MSKPMRKFKINFGIEASKVEVVRCKECGGWYRRKVLPDDESLPGGTNSGGLI